MPTYDKKYYFLTIVDDYSRFTWVYLLQLKSEVIVVLKQFLYMIQNQFGMMVKVLRSDNGSEFFNSKCNDFLKTLGIQHQSSCPYTPQQNGTMERKHRQILNIARPLRFQAMIPLRYRGMCSKAVVYLMNRLPSVAIGGSTPYELLNHQKPSLFHLRVIGCLCYAANLQKGDKF